MDATWQMLGRAAGTKDVGVNRVRVAAGQAADPAALARRLRGDLLRPRGLGARLAGRRGARGAPRRLRDPPGRPPRAHVRRRPRRARLPRLRHASPDRDRLAAALARDPASAGPGWRVATTTRGTSRRPARRSRSATPAPRPENIVNIDEVELEHWGDKGVTAPLATRDRSDLAGFHWERLNPGKTGAVPHCHSAEEEIFVILEGAATLHLWPSPLRAERGAEREQHEVRPGHVVARPPGQCGLALVPGRRRRRDDADLRHP